MAQRTAAAASGPKTKRTGGFAVTVKGFVPMDPKNADKNIKVMEAVRDAQAGKPSALLKLLEHTEVVAAMTSRALPVKAPGSESQQTDEGKGE